MSDFGWIVIQDAFAILLAANHGETDLLGVSTVHGNARESSTAYNTLAILQAMGRAEVPVIRGEARPLHREACFAPEYHGQSGLDGVSLLPQPDKSRLDSLQCGVERISHTIMLQPPDSVWIVATGPLTNIAKMFLETPEVIGRIRGLSIMGGAIGNDFTDAPMHRKDGPGNWTQFAEFNIYCDPEAAQTIFDNPDIAKKTTMITLDLTHQCRGTAAVQELLFGAMKQSRLRRTMQEILTFFTDTYRVHSGIEDGPPLHDPLAVYAVLHPEAFDTNNGERWRVETSLGKENPGQTILHGPVADGVQVPRGVDVTSFWEAIDGALARAEEREHVSP